MSVRLSGVGVSSGRASGPVVRLAEPPPEPMSGAAPAHPEVEAARIRPATEAVAGELTRRAELVDGDARAVLETTAAMAADPALLAQSERLVTERSLPATRAVFEAADTFASALREAGGYMAERARDIADVRDRVIAELDGVEPPGVPELAGPSVLVARDLAPADTAALDPELVLALVTEEGGPTSHTAILARSLEIPAVVAVRGVLATRDATGITVDGDSGQVELSAGAVPARAAERVAASDWDGVGRTADGHAVKLLGNVGAAADAADAAAAGAQGVGLFRTEFCYLSADREPTAEEQRVAYAEVLRPFVGKPVIVRTLDAGSDKPLPFVNIAVEANPALGVRGIRLCAEHSGLLDRQLAAIAGAAADTGVQASVMAPMVSTAAEAAWFVERARAAGIDRAGVMIEVPAAALCAREVLAQVDFASVGTNDLAQYVLAADRTSGALASFNDPWQPATLRLLSTVASAGADLGRSVGVCGEAAADPLLARVFVGIGATSLSMAGAALPRVGAALARNTRERCERAASVALAAASPDEAREAARGVLA